MPLGEVHLHAQTVCQSVQDLVQIPKDSLRQTHTVEFWSGSKRNDREAEQDSG